MTLSSHPHLSSQLPLPFHSSPTPEEIFARVFRRLCAGKPLPQIRVTFREWAQLRSTIRLTRAGVEVEISDTLRDASAMVLEALAEILICRLNGSRPSREARACYLSCIMSPPMRQRIDEARRARGFKLMRPAKGRCFDLRQIFDQLNREYFKANYACGRSGGAGALPGPFSAIMILPMRPLPSANRWIDLRFPACWLNLSFSTRCCMCGMR